MDRKNSGKRPLSSSLQEKAEKLAVLVEKIVDKSREGAVIVVEGSKDVHALRSLGVKGEIFSVKTRRIPLYDVFHELLKMERELIILTDFDRRGTQLAGKMTHYLEHHGKAPNLTFWLKLKGLLSGDVKDVEGLAAYVENIKRATVNI
ncbi:toprim domain-containing protein [Candidatus Hecatella orcuttiae]|uniref:toprim domain-containing protein n=1 Tax=Candidatus Hecatella orcuttiae TaxID=1935119 RepID=UPI002867EB92|nr:toprim domain-containing protein [Candidatus Hecatella orcuttiae]